MSNPILNAMFTNECTDDDADLLELLADLADQYNIDGDKDTADDLADNLTSEPLPLELFDTFYKKEEQKEEQQKTAIIEEIKELTAEELTEAITQQNKITYGDMAGFEITKIDGLNHIINKTAGGAEEKLMKNLKYGNVAIKRVYAKYAGRANFQSWTQCTPLTFLTLVKSNKYLYEIVGNYPYKPYFDIDKKFTEDPKISIDEFIPYYKVVLSQFFKNAEYAISGSITAEKLSLHIVINNYLVTNDDELRELRKIVKFIHNATLETGIDDGFDCGKYSLKKTIMKAVNQCKPLQESRIQKPITEADNLHKHIITAFFDPNPQPWPMWDIDDEVDNKTTKEIKIKLETERMAKPLNVAKLPIKQIKIDFDIFTATPQQLFSIVPLTDGHTHTYTAKIAIYCYHNNITFDEFYKWRIENKRMHKSVTPERHREKWRNRWDQLIPQRDEKGEYILKPISSNTLIFMLIQDYPNLHTNKFFNDFKTMWNDDIFNDCYRLDVDRLDFTQFDNVDKYQIVNIGMGGGKTAQTINYLKREQEAKKSFIWITPNKALAQNTTTRMTADGLRNDMYLNAKTAEAKGELRKSDNLLICLNSLKYSKELTKWGQYKIVVIDEIETFLIKWFDNSTLNNKDVDKRMLWQRLIQILQNAEKVIFLDAYITSHTMDFITAIDPTAKCTLIRKIAESSPRKVQFIKCYKNWLQGIITDLIAGKKIFVFYPFKRRQTNKNFPSMEELKDYLIFTVKQQANKDIMGKYYHGETDQIDTLDLYDVNNKWENLNFIICNNKITVGLSYEGANIFDRVYIGVAGFNEPRDIIQVSCRAREIKDNLIKICIIDKYNPNVNYKNDGHYLKTLQHEKEEFKCPIYDKVVKNILVERWGVLEQKLLLFIYKSHYEVIDSDDFINSELKKKFDEYLKNQQIKFTYGDIRLIENEEYEHIKKLMYETRATEREMMEYKKYEYNELFKTMEQLEEEGQTQYRETDEDGNPRFLTLECLKSIIWDQKYFVAMEQMQLMLWAKDHHNYKIINEIEKLFDGDIWPTEEKLTEIIRKKIKLPSDLLDLIFKDNYRTLTKKSATIHILKGFYNGTFKKNVITVKTGDDGKAKKHTATTNDYMIGILQHIEIITHRRIYTDKYEEAGQADTRDLSDEELLKLITYKDDDITTNEDY